MAGQLPDFSAGGTLVGPSQQPAPLPDFSAGGVPVQNVSTSPLAALRNSAGAVVSGIGNLGKSIDQAIVAHAPAIIAKGLGATGDLANGTDQAVVNAGQAVAGPEQYDGQSVHRLGADLSKGNLGAAAYDAAGALASAAPYAAVAAVPYAGPAILGASGAGNTVQSRMQAQGEVAPSAGDALAGAGSAALNTVTGPLAHGVMGAAAPFIKSAVSGPIARAAGRLGLGSAAGAVQGAGNYALDTAGTGQGTPQGLGNAAVEGAGTGALASAVTGPASASRTALQNARTASQAGPDVQAYAQETAPWTAAVQQARQVIAKGNPQLSPDDVDQAAQAQVTAQGIKAPTYDTLTPEAQRGYAQMNVLNLYNQRLQTETTGMGKSAASVNPSNVFKSVMDDLAGNIKQTGQGLVASGDLTADQNKTLTAAVAEAVRNNRNPGQGGADAGYFNTLRDQVAALPLPTPARNTLLLNLQMADIAQQNSMKMAAQGPLERNAGKIGGIAGAVAGAALGGLDGHSGGIASLGLESLGGMKGLQHLSQQAMVRAGARQLDQIMGNQLPPLLRSQQAVQAYAARQGLPTGAGAADLMALQAQAAANAPQEPPAPTPVQAGQLQAAKTLAATLGKLGPEHPLGMQAMQDLVGMGQHPMVAQALARYNGLGGLRSAQDEQAQQDAATASAGALAALKAKQAAQGNAQAVKDQGFLSKLTNRGAQADAQAVWQPQAPNAGKFPAPTALSMLQAVSQAAQAKTAAQQAQDGAMLQSVKAAAPLLGTSWQRAISGNSGLPVTFIQDHLQGLVDNGALSPADHTALTSRDLLPAGTYHHLNDLFTGMANANNLPLNVPGLSNAQTGPDLSGVRNPAAYKASIQQHDALVDDIRTRNPDLADMANAIATIKTAEGRRQALAGYLAAETDPEAQARLEEVLGPLTQYGWKPSSGTPHPDAAARAGALAALRRPVASMPMDGAALRAMLKPRAND